MPVESAADRLSFLSTDEFGSSGSYTPVGGTAASVAGIFNDPHLRVEMGQGAPTSDSQPTFTCRTADLPAGAVGGNAGDTLLIGATTWRVIDLQGDGTGFTTIILGS